VIHVPSMPERLYQAVNDVFNFWIDFGLYLSEPKIKKHYDSY
jgi:hypothetical protein